MSILIGLLYVVEVVSSLLLALVVMLQKPKEGGLGGLAGGMGEAVFGADAGNVLIKVTVWLGVIFLANTLLLARFTSKSEASESAMANVEQRAPASVPAAPAEIDTAAAEKIVQNIATNGAAPAAAVPEKPAAPAAPAAPAKN